MFNINSRPLFRTTVKLPELTGDDAAPQSFTATYRALSDDELGKFDRSTIAGIQAMLRAAIVTLDDLVDDRQQPVAYSEALRDQLLSQQFMRACLVTGYFDAIVGHKQGN